MHRPLFVALALLIVGAAMPAAVWPAERSSAAGVSVSQTLGSPAAIVGLWLVSPYPDRPSDREVAIFDTDGFMFASNSPSMPATPGEAPPGVTQLFSSQGYGLWQSQPDGTVAFRFLSIAYDQNGGYQGYASIRGNLTLDPSVATFSGTYTVTITSPDGTSMEVQGPTALTGMRAGL
ncbi:MAG TPA: hypothetical protein VK821_15430 [Dehalococcoidia bacterium]|nr:hypothetical protein [Dehalococcoidia bacterium]